MKKFVKDAYCGFWRFSGAMAVQEQLARWSGSTCMSVLLFHRVTDLIPPDGLTVSTQWFRKLCRMLQRRFNVVSLGEFRRIQRAGETPPPRTVAITFDDCYYDNLAAARTLAEHNLPACFFVPTQFVGTDHVFEWDRDLPRMPNLSWDDVRAMVRLGHDIGSHTVSHPDLGQLEEDKARYELTQSKQKLEQELERPIHWFAYPYGGRENLHLRCLPLIRQAGYDACFSGYGGSVDPYVHYPVIPREPMPYFQSLLNLELHLTGCMDWVYALKRHTGMIAST